MVVRRGGTQQISGGPLAATGFLPRVQIERNREQLEITQTTPVSRIGAEKHSFPGVVLPAVARSNPVAHPSEPRANVSRAVALRPGV